MGDEGDEVPRHHLRLNICATRKRYRDGRRDTAVKVYTVSQESRYVMIVGVPAVGASQDLIKLCALYGQVDEYRILDEYPGLDEYTEAYWVKFNKIQAARVAKRRLDDRSFMGGVLHVFYSPEYETESDTRLKLAGRRRWVARQIRIQKEEPKSEPTSPTLFIDVIESPPTAKRANQRQWKKHQATPSTGPANQQPADERLAAPTSSANQGLGFETNHPHAAHAQNFANTPNYNSSNNASHASINHMTVNSRMITPHGFQTNQRSVPMISHRMMPPYRPTNPRPVQFGTRDVIGPPFQTWPRPDMMAYPSNQFMGSPHDDSAEQFPRNRDSNNGYFQKHRGAFQNPHPHGDMRGPRPRHDSTFKRKSNSPVSTQDTGPSLDIAESRVPNTEDRSDVQKSDPNEKLIRGIKIKPYTVKSVPRFVPRQLKGKVPEYKEEKNEQSGRKRDELDDVIRRNAYVLGPVSGPSQRPGTVRDTIRTKQDESLEKTRSAIRDKLKTLCPTLLPRQLRKRKRPEPEMTSDAVMTSDAAVTSDAVMTSDEVT